MLHAVSLSTVCACCISVALGVEPVTLSQQSGTSRVLLGQQPIGANGKVKGLAGFGYPNVAKAIGANAFRTWDYSQWHWAFKNANEYGLKVSAGIGVTREKRYYTTDRYCSFTETDPYWINTLKKISSQVLEYKSNHALLWWTVGNELEEQVSFADGNDCLWKRVEWLAAKVKELDPHHPVGTVLANVAPGKIGKIGHLCPSLDFVGINVYGNDARNLGGKLRSWHWTKPYAIMEYGVPGWWSVPTTSWGARLETMTSTLKAPFFTETFNECDADKQCLGSWAFLWGWKWEKTGTWFGLFDQWKEAGGNNYAVDTLFALEHVWKPQSGIKPPVGIKSVNIRSKNGLDQPFIGFSADPQAMVKIHVDAVGAVKDVTWLVTRESDSTASGNAREYSLAPIKGAVRVCGSPGLSGILDTSKLDLSHGKAFRVYIFVRASGSVGTAEASASIPFFIGRQDCQTSRHGDECFREVNKNRDTCKRRGVCSWPADALLPSSSFQEFQAAFHKHKRNNCPAPCSLHVEAGLHVSCADKQPHAATERTPEANSCAHYGCVDAYVFSQSCQCNQECSKHNSCCSDYTLTCVENPHSVGTSSCARYGCGRSYSPLNKCQCNEDCSKYGSCCSDYTSLCVEKRSSGADANTCAHYGCGADYVPSNSCQCNEECAQHGSCCSDYKSLCTRKTNDEDDLGIRCGSAEPRSRCAKAVQWAMTVGIRHHPDWYPDLTTLATADDFQYHMHKSGLEDCGIPCQFTTTVTTTTSTATSTSTTGTSTTTTTSAAPCEDAAQGSACLDAVHWARRSGIHQHPDWYPGLSHSSSNAEFQAHLHSRGQGECPKPCFTHTSSEFHMNDYVSVDATPFHSDVFVLRSTATGSSAAPSWDVNDVSQRNTWSGDSLLTSRPAAYGGIVVGSVLAVVGAMLLYMPRAQRRHAREPTLLSVPGSDDDALE